MKIKTTESIEICSYCGCCISGDYIEYDMFEADPVRQCQTCTDGVKAFLYGVSAQQEATRQ